MTEEQGTHDEISDETRDLVTRVRVRAAQSPGAAELASLLTAAGAQAPGMSAEQIRALGRDTLVLAGQVSYLLGKLAGLLDEEGGEVS